MKVFLIIILFSFTLIGMGQSSRQKTVKYAGTYSFDWENDSLPSGFLVIYPESDTSLLYYIENDKGAPSHDNGIGYGRIIKKNGSAVFYLNDSTAYGGKGINCMLYFKFRKRRIIIKTIDGHTDCGYGFGVYSDGTYYLKDKKIPKYFISGRDTVYFGDNTYKKWYGIK